MDLLRALQIFVRVAETGGFARAGESLQTAASSVTTAVQQLEAHLGTRLFQRTTRRVRLTPDGELLYERGMRLLAEAAETAGLFSGATPSGRLRLEVPARIGRLIVAPALPAFLERHPALDLELTSSDRIVDLVEEGVDCVLRVGGGADDGRLIAQPLGRMRQVTCASPAYLARHGVPRQPDDLRRHRIVHFAPLARDRSEAWQYGEGEAAITLALRGRVTVNNAEAYIACCKAGLGLIQIPAYDVADAIGRGELVEVLAQHAPPSLPIRLLYTQRLGAARGLRALAEWLRRLVAERVLAVQDELRAPRAPPDAGVRRTRRPPRRGSGS
jgi:DNA-binding transcriptional LysR family regulator